MKKIEITTIQALQFNAMLDTLKTIAKGYQTPEQLKRNCEKQFGLEYSEALEMSYENIQIAAKIGSKGIKPVKFQS